MSYPDKIPSTDKILFQIAQIDSNSHTKPKSPYWNMPHLSKTNKLFIQEACGTRYCCLTLVRNDLILKEFLYNDKHLQTRFASYV